MSKKVSRFEQFKVNQKTEIESASRLKNKLLLLANDMLKAKQISKAVFNKMEKLTIQRTRRNTLVENLEGLQAIKEQFKSKQADQRETKTNTKKYSIQELKQLQKDIKADNDVTYQVYIKYKMYVRPDRPNRPIEEIVIDHQKIKAQSYINNESIKVNGTKNIKYNLKLFINSLMESPYTYKVDILKVIINKEIISDSKYRWLGAEKKQKRIKKGQDWIRYFKAWNATFTHHKYNLDNNNEIPFECVPNALFKMYGNRQNKGYIASIAKGGIEYVKRKLDGYEISDLDFGLDMVKEDKKGYTPDQILKFCSDHKIRCFGYDWKMEQFITNKYDGITFNHDNLPAFVFYMNDEHIYLIQDQEIRHAILRTSNKNDIISLIAKQKERKAVTEQAVAVDLPFDEWANVSDTKIYITKQRLVHDKFYSLVCNGDVYNNKLKMSEGEGVIRFEYKNKNTIIYNPDYHEVMETLKKLESEKYTFSNQRLNTLAKEVLDKEFGGLPESSMNQQGDEIFHSDFIRNCQFNGWISEPEDGKLHAYDYNKHYTSCLRGDGLRYGFPIYNVFDEIQPFSGSIRTGFYFVETQNFFPFRGNGWYDADLVYFGVWHNIIDVDNIKFQYCSSQELGPDHFKAFIAMVYEKFENPKAAINKMIGCFGHDYKNKNTHHFTSDARNVFLEVVNNPDASVKYIYHNEFLDNSDNKVVKVEEIEVSDYISSDKPVCFHLYNNKRVKHLFNSLPLFYKIYNVSAMKMYQMAQKVGGTVRGIFTDTIIFEGAITKPACDASVIGGIRKSNLKSFTHVMDTQPRNDKYKHVANQFTYISDFKLEDGKGVFITGLGGTGKSYTINQLKSQLQPEEFRVCTPTLKSALIVDAVTVYNLFNINPHDHTYCKSTVEKLRKEGVKYIFIDEVSMINSKVWACIRDFKKIYGFIFILSGDFLQLPPVEAIEYNVMDSQVFHYICDGQIMELTKNWRAAECPEFKSFSDDLITVRNKQSIDFKAYGRKACRRSLCWTNRTRNVINKKWMLQEAEGKKCFLINNWKVFSGLPIIANVTRVFKESKEKIVNNEEFTVDAVLPKTIKISNDRISLEILHSELKHFELAYCLTVHKSQGSTYNFEYSIYEYHRFDSRMLYTAMSRATEKSYVNFVYIKTDVRQGFIYKITSPNGKIYIGSTTTSILQRFEEHRKCDDNSPLHRDMQAHPEGWKIEQVDALEYVDEQELLIAETCQMISHDSINNGYNTKYSVDLLNLY